MVSKGKNDQLINAQRLRNRYLVPRGHPAPEDVRSKLDTVAETALRDALSATLYPYLDPSSEAIWFIRRLKLDLSVNAAWDKDRLARVWATQFAKELVTTIESDGEERDIIKFENRAAYIRQFFTDLVDECAWSRWYYQPFIGLKLLPVSSAIRTVVCDNPEHGIDALAGLPPEKIKRVVLTLSVHDVRRVLQSLPFASKQVTVRHLLETAWRVYETTPEIADYAEDDRAALAVCLHVARTDRESLDRSLPLAVRALCRLMRIAQRDPNMLQTVKRILETGSSAPLYVVVSPEDAAALGPLVEGDPVWLEAVFTTIEKRATGRVTPEPVEEIVIRQTPFGGIFLLLPIVSDLPIDAATRGWAPCGDTPAESLVRFLVLAKCLGGACLPRMLLDPVAREMVGVDPKLRLQDIIAWYDERSREEHAQFVSATVTWIREARGVNSQPAEQGQEAQRKESNRSYLAFVDPMVESPSAFRAFGFAAYAVLTTFSRKLPGFSQSSFPHLRANFLECAATLEDQDTRRVVQLTRPPLDLILNMTGLSRATYRLPWLDLRSFALFPQGGP
jgi:hypothetical protein